MMEDVANTAAKNVAKDVKIEMLQMEKRLEMTVDRKLDEKLQAHFGMTPQEHAVEHDRMRKIYNMWSGFTSTFWTRTFLAAVILSLGITAGSFLDLKAITQPKPEPIKEQSSRGFE